MMTNDWTDRWSSPSGRALYHRATRARLLLEFYDEKLANFRIPHTISRPLHPGNRKLLNRSNRGGAAALHSSWFLPPAV